MKQDKLDVGVKGFSVTVNVNVPENDKDVATLSKNSEAYRVQKFVRGWRIDNQEDSGARDYVLSRVAGKDAAMLKDAKFIAEVTAGVQAIVDKFDPTAPRQRGGRPAAPKVVTLPKGKKSLSMEDVQKLLAAQGLTTIVSE